MFVRSWEVVPVARAIGSPGPTEARGRFDKPRGECSRFEANGAAYLTFGKPEVKAPHWMGDIEIDPRRSERAMFITGAGIFATENLTQADQGATFARINDDHHQFAGATHIAGDPRVAGRVYVGTGGRGIFYGTPR
jgi:hypothetical protein